MTHFRTRTLQKKIVQQSIGQRIVGKPIVGWEDKVAKDAQSHLYTRKTKEGWNRNIEETRTRFNL